MSDISKELTINENLDLNLDLPKLFKYIGLVITIADGIVTVIGINDVGYMKL